MAAAGNRAWTVLDCAGVHKHAEPRQTVSGASGWSSPLLTGTHIQGGHRHDHRPPDLRQSPERPAVHRPAHPARQGRRQPQQHPPPPPREAPPPAPPPPATASAPPPPSSPASNPPKTGRSTARPPSPASPLPPP